MSEKYEIDYKDNIVHIVKRGETDRETSAKILSIAVEMCESMGCFNILGETFGDTNLSTMDAFGYSEIFREVGIDARYRIAWVVHEDVSMDMAGFVETVLKNRRLLNGGLFPDVESAKKWLASGESRPS